MSNWNDTIASYTSLEATAKEGWKEPVTIQSLGVDPISQQVDYLTGMVDSASSSVIAAGEEFKSGLSTSWDYFSSGWTKQEGESKSQVLSQLQDVGDAVGSASIDYLASQLEKLKNLWNQRTTITVKSMIGEVAPYAAALSQGKGGETISLLGNKISELYNNLTDNVFSLDALKGSAKEAGQEYLTFLSQNSNITSSIASINVVKGVVNTVDTASRAIDRVSTIMKTLEPIMPIVEVTASIAASWITGGTSAAEAMNKLAEEAQKLLQDTTRWALNSIKEYLYNIKIEVPTIILSNLKSLSLRDDFSIITDKNDEDYNEALQFLFDSGYTLPVADTSTYKNSIISALNTVNSDVKSFYNFGLSAEAQKTFLGNIAKNFMTSVVNNARAQISMDSIAKTMMDINKVSNSSGALEEDSKASQMLYDDETLRLTTKYLYESIVE